MLKPLLGEGDKLVCNNCDGEYKVDSQSNTASHSCKETDEDCKLNLVLGRETIVGISPGSYSVVLKGTKKQPKPEPSKTPPKKDPPKNPKEHDED